MFMREYRSWSSTSLERAKESGKKVAGRMQKGVIPRIAHIEASIIAGGIQPTDFVTVSVELQVHSL